MTAAGYRVAGTLVGTHLAMLTYDAKTDGSTRLGATVEEIVHWLKLM